jgi:hypothetical protein
VFGADQYTNLTSSRHLDYPVQQRHRRHPRRAAAFSSQFPADFPSIDLYPFVYVLPSGKVLVHSRDVTCRRGRAS